MIISSRVDVHQVHGEEIIGEPDATDLQARAWRLAWFTRTIEKATVATFPVC
jgi:hypothetical protein